MASLFIRTYTFVDGTTAYGSQVEAEIGNIVTVLNNLNTAATTWGIVSSAHATSVPLVADCSSGSQDIADFKNNSVIKASIGSGGQLTLKPTTNQIVLGVTNTTTLSATAPSASRTYTMPDTGGSSNFLLSSTALVDNSRVNAAGYIKGTIVQTSQGVDTATTSSSGSTYTSTTTTASITPLATTHKIKITVSGVVRNSSLNTFTAYVSVFRGSTDLGAAAGTGFSALDSNTATGSLNAPCSFVFLDSPASTSALTYTVKIKGTADVKWNADLSNAIILLEELAA